MTQINELMGNRKCSSRIYPKMMIEFNDRRFLQYFFLDCFHVRSAVLISMSFTWLLQKENIFRHKVKIDFDGKCHVPLSKWWFTTIQTTGMSVTEIWILAWHPISNIRVHLLDPPPNLPVYYWLLIAHINSN